MAIHSDALARVLARLEQTLVQGFTRSFLRVCKGCNRCVQPCLTYMCARAPVHARWITSNPCNSCNPCSPFFRMAVIRHSLSTDRARVAQGCACSCKGLHPLGGGRNLTGVSPPRPLSFSRRDFFYVEQFSGWRFVVRSPSRIASPSDAWQNSTCAIAALRPCTSSHGAAADRRRLAALEPTAASINFPHAKCGR